MTTGGERAVAASGGFKAHTLAPTFCQRKQGDTLLSGRV